MPAEDGIETAKGVLTAGDEEFNVEEVTEERTMDAGCTEVTHNETAKDLGDHPETGRRGDHPQTKR